MIRKVDIVVGVDPDVDKSGVATLTTVDRKVSIMSMSFPTLLDYLQSVKYRSEQLGQSYCIVVEAGWLNRSNWHINPRDSKAVCAAKGQQAGRNHEVGRKVLEMCRHWQMPCEEQQPLVKIWKGHDRKITSKELTAIMGVTGRTNQDGRDAALLAWVWAGLPIRLNQRK